MRSITKLDLQYAHRFYGFKGEAQYLHGHTGVLTIEVEDTVEPGVNMVFPCNEIKKTAWEVAGLCAEISRRRKFRFLKWRTVFPCKREKKV